MNKSRMKKNAWRPGVWLRRSLRHSRTDACQVERLCCSRDLVLRDGVPTAHDLEL